MPSVTEADGEVARIHFDRDFYLLQNQDVKLSSESAFDHYMRVGWREHRDPSPAFCTAFYRDTYPDVDASGLNPFVHWLLIGKAEGRSIACDVGYALKRKVRDRLPEVPEHALTAVLSMFDRTFYLRKYPDVAGSGQEPILHYLDHGARELRDPTAAFSTYVYSRIAIGLRDDVNPFVHWILARANSREGLQHASSESEPSDTEASVSAEELAPYFEYFDAGFYRDACQLTSLSEAGLLQHYLNSGWRLLYDPSANFSTTYYLRRYGDILAAGVNPLVHYQRHGQAELRRTQSFYAELANRRTLFSVSVIIPDCAGSDQIEGALREIAAQDYAVQQVIVVGSTLTEGAARSLSEEVRFSVAASVSRALSAATCDLVWFASPSYTYERSYLSSLAACFRDKSVTLALGSRTGAGIIDQDGGDVPAASRDTGFDSIVTQPAAIFFSNVIFAAKSMRDAGNLLWRRAESTSVRVAGGIDSLSGWICRLADLAAGGQISLHARASYSIGASRVPSQDWYDLSVEDSSDLLHRIGELWSLSRTTVSELGLNYWSAKFPVSPSHQAGHSRELELALFKARAQKRTQPHVLLALWSIRPGGGEYFPIMLANEIRKKGFTVSLLCFEMSSVDADMYRQIDPSIPVFDAAWVDDYGADRFLSDAGISLIHSHTVGSEVQFFDHWRVDKCPPYLVTLHGSYEDSDLDDDLVQAMAARVSHFVYTADKNLRPFDNCLPVAGKFSKLQNAMPFDPKPFPSTRAELGIDENAVVFTLVARGVKQKGWEPLLRAFSKLKASVPDGKVHLLLCGGGSETDRLYETYKGDPAISFIGYQTRINGLYALSDVCVVPSRFTGESFPLCIIQALQSGCPVIATRVGEIHSMLTEADQIAGILIEPSADNAIFEAAIEGALRTMLDDEQRGLYRQCALKLADRYDMANLATKYLGLYFDLLARSDRAC